MAFDIFLKLDGIDGESQDDKHKDWIEVSSYTFGASNFNRAPAGTTAGKVAIQDFHFVMKGSSASPMLFSSCASGKHIDSAVLSLRKAGSDQADYLQYKLTDVLVSSYQTGGTGASADAVPTDQISLNFSKIETTYTSQNTTGTIQQPVTAGWDIQANKSI